MIRMTTDLVPSRFLTYKELLKALTGLMVIAYIIMIRKHLKTLASSVHRLWLSSTTRRNRHNSCLRWLGGTCHWSPHTSNVSRSTLVTGWLAHTCPMARHDCRGLHTRFRPSRPLTNVVHVDRAGQCSQCTLAGWSCEGTWVNDHRPPFRKTPVSRQGRRGLNNPIAHYSRPRVPFFSAGKCYTTRLRCGQSPASSQMHHTRVQLYWYWERLQIPRRVVNLQFAWG